MCRKHVMIDQLGKAIILKNIPCTQTYPDCVCKNGFVRDENNWCIEPELCKGAIKMYRKHSPSVKTIENI